MSSNGSNNIKRLWIFDFDGTLSPLVSHRKKATLPESSGRLLYRLAADPESRVAIISSRALDDLIRKVSIPGIYLGGGSGLEWRLPDKNRVMPPGIYIEKLLKARKVVDPLLEKFSTIRGVDLEEKCWSVALHFRNVGPDEWIRVSSMIKELRKYPGICVFEGPAVAEVQFFRSANKSFGVRRLCRMLGFRPDGNIFYAGDDENDAKAMKWIVSRNGTAIIVGGIINLRGIPRVNGPEELVRAVNALFDRRSPVY